MRSNAHSYRNSARYYERALAADPASSQTLNNIGYAYLMQERFDLAVAYLRDAHSRDGKDPVVLANRKTAEESYQEADLKRSAENARDSRRAPSVSAPSQPQVAALSPPRRAPVASKRRVKTWIERTAPTVQSLVTQPQLALLGAVEDVGIDPQLAAYQPQQPAAADLLPDHATAPMALDALPSPDRREAVLQEVHSASMRPEAPQAADQTWRVLMTASIADPAPVEVVVASLDSAHEMRNVAPDQELPESQAAAIQVAAIQVAAIQVAAIEATAIETTTIETSQFEAAAIEDSPVEAENGSPSSLSDLSRESK